MSADPVDRIPDYARFPGMETAVVERVSPNGRRYLVEVQIAPRASGRAVDSKALERHVRAWAGEPEKKGS